MANSDQPACTATAPASPATRREIRDLTAEQWEKFVAAMWAMKTTSLADGIVKYGEGFKPYDYFVVKHSVSVWDSRGDQLHFSDGFATSHCLFLREFEVNLMLIDPTIEGLPYWNANSDIFNDDYYGSVPGTGANNEVIDGQFANWPIAANFSMNDWTEYIKTVEGASNGYTRSEGFLRDEGNPLSTSSNTRYGYPLTIGDDVQAACVTEPECWNNWYDCIESTSDLTANFHSGPHVLIGGPVAWGSTVGDFKDPTTSPNEPLFWSHHANVDRNRIDWMTAHADLKESYWGYGGLESGCKSPPSMERASCEEGGITGGVDLDEVINALFPFTSTQLNLEGLESEGLTHREALCYFGPETAPYTYSAPASAGGQPGAQQDNTTWQWVLGISLTAAVAGCGVAFASKVSRKKTEEDETQLANVS